MFWTVFWMLMCGHALADFPLQTPDMAKGKNYTIDPAHNAVPWYYWLASHCFVHGLSVTLSPAFLASENSSAESASSRRSPHAPECSCSRCRSRAVASTRSSDTTG